MKKTLLLFLLLPFLGFTQTVPAGSYVISSASAAPLNSLSNAIAYINPRGIAGNVTLLIDNDQIVSTGNQIVIDQFTGSANYTLTIKPNNGKTINITGDVNGSLFLLDGADNIIIDGNNTVVDNALKIYNNHTTSAENSRIGIRLSNNADKNIFRNLSIQLNILDKTKDVYATGIFSGGANIGDAGNNSNNIISNIKFINVKQPVFIVGNSDNNNKNWTIEKNTMGSDIEDNQPSLGIYLSNVNGYIISNNTITGITKNSNYNARTASGITLLETTTGSVYNNVIGNITNKHYTNSSSTAGIFINTSSSSSATIYNNIISNIYTAQNDNNDYNYHYPGHGIYIKTSGTNKLYFNTIVQKATSTTNGRSSCIFIEDATSVDLKNNILYNSRTSGTQYALFSRITPTKLTSNYNAFYGTNLENIIRSESSSYNLANWRSFFSQDLKSTITTPTFVDLANSNFHLNPATSSNIDLQGISIATVTTDIDGDTRVKPYMGADEINSCTPPTISTQPANLIACEGQNGSFSVATPTAGATYQWQYSADGSTGWTNTDGTQDVSDHNTATLKLTNMPTSYSGYFVRCIVYKSATCFTYSNNAKLTVNSKLVASVNIASSETPTYICDDTQVTFTATPTNGGNAPTYQWFIGTTQVQSGTSSTYKTSALKNSDVIKVIMTADPTLSCSTASPATSNEITVTIIKTDRGATRGGDHFCYGSAYPKLGVYNTEGPDKDKLYTESSKIIRWEYSDDNNKTWVIIDNTAGLTTYTHPGTLTVSRNFRAVAKSPNCKQGFASIETRVDVEFAPTINSQSTATQTQCIGGTFNALSVTATGYGTLKYQWYSNPTASTTNGTLLAGATADNYVPKSTTAGTLYYYCIVTGKCGPTTSTSSEAIITKAAQAAPKVGTIKQPTCTTSTGSVILEDVPSSGKLIESSGTVYNFTTSGTTFEITGLAPGTYKFAIDNSCTKVYSADIVIQPANTWNGTKWSNGTPTADNIIEFKGNYSENVDLTGCSCTISNNAVVTIKSGKTLKITNAVKVVSGSLTFENNASLMQDNSAINTGNITYKRIAPKIRQADYVYWSTPVTPQTLIGVSPLTEWDKYFYNNPYTGWTEVDRNTNMLVGKGYIIRGPENISNTDKSDYEASFIGVPNNGTLYSESLDNDLYHLIGNPYPSALSLDALIDVNKNLLNGTIYIWTHNTGVIPVGNYDYNVDDYAVYNGTGSVAPTGNPANVNEKPTGYIGAGQSFFASTKSTGKIVFNNSMRFGGTFNSQFFKPTSKESGIEKNRIWLNITSSEGPSKQLLVGYIQGATNAYEDRFDGVSFESNPYLDFYSMIDENKFVIQGRSLPFVETDVVPLGYTTTIAGNFTVAIDEVDGNLTSQKIYVEDKTTGAVHDLTSSNYTFKSEAGSFTNRLVLRYTDKTLGTGDFENLDNGILVSVKSKAINILSSKENIKEVTVYDISGKLLYNKKKIGSTELQIQNLQSGNQVLLVKITLENDFVTTKKIIFN